MAELNWKGKIKNAVARKVAKKILCRHCNNILGEMEKNGKIIKGLEKYLRKYGKVVRKNTKNKRKN